MSSLKGFVGGAQKLTETFFGFLVEDRFRLIFELSNTWKSIEGSLDVLGNTKLKQDFFVCVLSPSVLTPSN